MIISLTNQKGGVGKTTTAINLSAALALLNEKVLIIDFDPQSNTSSGLGIDPADGQASAYDVLMNEVSLKDAIVSTGRDNLYICPGNMDLAGAEIELVDETDRESKLKAILADVKDDYDEIIIDCPPSLGLLTLNALTASEGIIIPIQTEYYALEGLSQLLETVEAVRSNWNESLEIIGALLTMYDTRTQLSKQVAEEVRKFFKDKVFEREIPRNVRLSEAPSFGQTIFEFERWSKGARAYRAVAKELLKRK